jgi:nicotinate-nucleotide--dimethylbenzimidazole phosphoribosyltransferase
MVMNFLSGGAAINVLCRESGMGLEVVDAGVKADFPVGAALTPAKIGHGTANFLNGPAMTNQQCFSAMQKGAEIAKRKKAGGSNTIAFGEMGIGNTSSSAMIMHCITGLAIEQCVGAGTGHAAGGQERKLQILSQCASSYNGKGSPMDILAHFGGFETAMICGAIIGAASENMLIIIDGFNVGAALLIASKLQPKVLDRCLAAHVSGEKGHRAMLGHIGLRPLLDIGMRLGEGTGAAAALPLVKMALAALNDMASFEDAGVSKA